MMKIYMKRLSSADIPQKENLDLIMELPEMIGEGDNTARLIANRIGQHVRHGSFVLHAGRLLGIVTKTHMGYDLTHKGRLLLQMEPDDRKHYLRSLILRTTIVEYLLYVARDENNGILDRAFISQILKADSDLSWTTSKRRASAICAWLKWLSQFENIREKSSGEYEVL